MDARAHAAVFGPVAPQNTYEEIVSRLGIAIRIGLLPPGSKLPPERDLADQLEISRSTLRQALGTLTESGHLIALRGRTGGTFVAAAPPIASGEPVHLADWRDLLDWRTAVELGAAQLAGERGGDGYVDRLDEAADHLDSAVLESWPAYRRADVAFHLALAEATGSPRLVAAMTEVHGELTDLLDRVTHPAAHLEQANDEHRTIVQCVRERDAAGAVQAMREHLDRTERSLEELLP